jgi:HEAT repeat protein
VTEGRSQGRGVADSNVVDHYVDTLEGPEGSDAWHGLVEMGASALPRLLTRFAAARDARLRADIISVVEQCRSDASLELLRSALLDESPDVWKSSLDALVTLGSRGAVEVLESAMDSAPPAGVAQRDWLEWVGEAVEQATRRLT